MSDFAPMRREALKRFAALKSERSTWDSHWRDLARYVRPRSSRFLSTDRNKGTKQNSDIINSTGTRALRILAAGLQAGLTSPARPWFQLGTLDRELNEYGAVKQWLHECETAIRQVLARSNLYNSLHATYESLGLFGTSVMLLDEDSETTVRGYNFPVGQYVLANSARGVVDTVGRELSLTVRQLEQKFGRDKLSEQTKKKLDNKQLDDWVELVWKVCPNTEYQQGKVGWRGKPWRVVWLEKSGSDTDQPLLIAGYEEFPCLAPRWDVVGEDVYGESPGMVALGDIKGLQALELRKGQLVDKSANPPMRAPPELEGRAISLLPGDVTFVAQMAAGQTFAPAHEVAPMSIQVVGGEIREHERRVDAAFYADLWLSLTRPGPQMTAREVAERHEEKMLQLGPVVERVTDELLDPLIERIFGVLERRGELPPAPEEVEGLDLKVEYISILAQAQKLLGTSSIERLSSFVGNLAAVNAEILDKVDFDQAVDEYGDALGVPPAIIRSDDQVAALRAQRAQQQAQVQQAAAAQQMVEGAKVLSETDTAGDNALTRLLGNLGAGPAA